MNYATLQTDVAAYLHRTDLTDKLAGFIERAESYLFRELAIKELELSVSGTTTGGYGALPTDFGTVSRITVTSNGSTRNLDYKALAEVPTEVTAYPLFYALETNQIRIWGAGDGQAYTLYYKPAIEPLSGSNSTNWLLDNAQDLYFYATVVEGARYTRNTAEVDRVSALLPALLDSVRSFNTRRGIPSSGSLQIRAR